MTKQKDANSPNARKFSMINIGIIQGLILFAPLFSEHLYRLECFTHVQIKEAEMINRSWLLIFFIDIYPSFL